MPKATTSEIIDYTIRRSQGDTRTPAERNRTTAMEANNRTLTSPVFQRACMLASMPATRRQASKWNARRGLAYSFRNEALRQIGGDK